MDFGNILDQWEKAQKKSPEKKSSVTGGEWRYKKTQPDKSAAEEADAAGKPGASGKAGNSSKPSSAGKSGAAGRTASPAQNPMSAWLRRYGVVDKDAQKEERECKEKLLNREELKKLPCEAEIDLHGLTSEEAEQRLNAFVTECCRRGIRKILIIHGKGNHSETAPVLYGLVRSFIERDYRLGESGHPDRTAGGKGATWVLIKDLPKN